MTSTKTFSMNGRESWHNENHQRHRLDGPALVTPDRKEWYINGKLHRTDGPAIEHADGTTEWYFQGQRHRLDGPAIEGAGRKEWYYQDKLHRIGAPAIEDSNGYKAWYIHGKCHRLDSPAATTPEGYQGWFLNDKCHRLDGPAVINEDGSEEWWINGDRLTPEQTAEQIARLAVEKQQAIREAMQSLCDHGTSTAIKTLPKIVVSPKRQHKNVQ